MARDRDAQVEVKFRRDLGLREIVMIGLGPTIGTTIFLLVGPGFGIAGPALLLVFVLNFVVTIFTAMAYAELSSAFPETGGGYLWVKTAFGGPVGFLGGWLSWFGHCIVCAFYVASFGIFVVLFAQPLIGTVPFEEVIVKGLSLALLLTFLYVNYRGTKTTGRSSSSVTLLLIGFVITFVVAGIIWFALNPSSLDRFTPFFPGSGLGGVVPILTAMGFTFIVFEGYEIIAQTGEEVREPEKNIPRANWITLSIATAIFVIVGFLTVVGLPASDTCKSGVRAVACAAEQFFSPFPMVGLGLIVVGVTLGSLTALNSLIYSSSRVAFAMGRDGSMPHLFGKLHKRNRTPYVAILASGLVIGVMIIGLDVIQIAASADLMFLLLFTLVNAAAIVLRKTHGHVRRHYLMPLFPLIPIVGLATKALLAVSLYLVSWVAVVLGAVWVVLGFGIHYLWAKREAIAEVAAPVIGALIPTAEPRYHILVPVEDLADRSLVEFATLVAKVEDGRITILNVIEVPDALPVDAIDPLYSLEVRRALGKLARTPDEAGVLTRARAVVSHTVPEAVLEVVQEEDVNLMVAGWRGTRRRGIVLGTNLDQLAQRAPCDIIVFKAAGLPEKLDRILVMNAPEWHVSHAVGYAIMLAKRHRASISIFSAVQTETQRAKEVAYSARLASMCQTHGIPFEERVVKVRSIVDAVVEEAKGYDLTVLGASSEWRLTQFAFGALQDQIARRIPGPVLMVRKVKRRADTSAKA